MTPTDEQVVDAARPYLERTPPLGVAKIAVALREAHGWSLSDKRLKKVLTDAGLRDAPRPSWVPVSSLDDTVPMPPGVAARYFDSVKGRGLVATRAWAEGQTLFVEDAFVAAPPPSELGKMMRGDLCTHCFLPTSHSPMPVSCGAGACGARFCHRNCQSRAMATHHALLCPGTNPAAGKLLQFLTQYQWHSVHTVARMLARALLTGAKVKPASIAPGAGATVHGLPSTEKAATWAETLHHLNSFATVSELERRARNPGWEMERAGLLPALQQAHELLCDALDPTRPQRPKKFPVPPDALPARDVAALLTWPSFLSLLGRANINMESHGGLYLVHSHLNHDCDPNVSIRHMPGRGGVRPATRITAIAKRAIAEGEELCISYVDPTLLADRRRLLLWRDYCFGPCTCQRCTAESDKAPPADAFDAAKASKLASLPMPAPPPSDASGAASSATAPRLDTAEIEQELRSSLGF